MANKREGLKNLDDAYKYYTNKYPKTNPNFVSNKVYKGICKRFNELITAKIIEENYIFKMPSRLGTLRIKKYKMKYNQNKMTLNFQEYKKTGIKTYYMNDHSNNYYYKWKWERTGLAILNKGKYRYKATRFNNRKLAVVIKSKLMDYFE